MDTYNYLAWTVHRNRFYTKAKYSFLKNSIDENERLAKPLPRHLPDADREEQKPGTLRLENFFPSLGVMQKRERMSVYHYKNILHSYSFNIDSAAHYFELMRKAGRLPP